MAKKKKVADDVEKSFYDPSELIDELLDQTEKKYGVSSTSLDRDEARLSTGLIALDLLLNGGIVGGGWYTVYGGEQSAKSTLTMLLLSQITAEVYKRERKIAASIWDFEGCLTGDTNLVIKIGDEVSTISFKEFVEKYSQYVHYDFQDVNSDVQVKLGSEFHRVQSTSVKPDKPITSVLLEDGKAISGFRHPILVRTESNTLAWRFLEDLQLGDDVVVSKGA